jgi:hypothetical protein
MGGVIGDDGLGASSLGQGSALGEAFLAVERLYVQGAETAVKRFPDVIHPWMQWASIAGHRRDWPEALRRWGEKLWNNEIDLGIGAGGSRAV